MNDAKDPATGAPSGAGGEDALIHSGDKEREAVLRTLQGRVALTKKRARRNRLWAIVFSVLAVVMVLAGAASFVDDYRAAGALRAQGDGAGASAALSDNVSGSVGILFFVGILGAVALAITGRQHEAEVEARDLEVEADLMSFPIPPRQVRAERLFRRNEYELLKYYTLNPRQSRAILAVGIGCILAGLGVVGLTFWAVMRGSAGITDQGAAIWMQAIVGVVGAVSAVLVNFVAAVYLKMHGENATALSAFHERLVGSNNLFLANLLVSRIDSEPDREKTLAEMALTLSKK